MLINDCRNSGISARSFDIWFQIKRNQLFTIQMNFKVASAEPMLEMIDFADSVDYKDISLAINGERLFDCVSHLGGMRFYSKV